MASASLAKLNFFSLGDIAKYKLGGEACPCFSVSQTQTQKYNLRHNLSSKDSKLDILVPLFLNKRFLAFCYFEYSKVLNISVNK